MERKSPRKNNWDYSAKATYLITIVCLNRSEFLGQLAGDRVTLSAIGKIVENRWKATGEMNLHIELITSVIMPDHFHGVIRFKKSTHSQGRHFGPQKMNLASVIRGFKSSVTSRAIRINPSFAWQPRYHDRILHTPDAVSKAIIYVRDNPKRAAQKKRYC